MRRFGTLIIGISLIFSLNALAGFTQPAVVVVDLDGMTASGDMWSARTAKDDVSVIGCGIKKFEGGLSFGFCQATDANDVGYACFTEDPFMLDAIHASSTYSYIRFNWNENDECTRIDVSNNSFYLPNVTTRGSD